jgi:hypothetical protein
MSQTFTRAFLQGLPEQRKREETDRRIQVHVDGIQQFAAVGKTSYMFEPDNKAHNPRQHPSFSVPVLTNDDFVAAFQRKFPDCTVTYQEAWVDVDATNRILKRGVVIDWS